MPIDVSSAILSDYIDLPVLVSMPHWVGLMGHDLVRDRRGEFLVV